MSPTTGEMAPDFSLPASTGETISLSGLRGRKVVIYFYPRDDTPGCTTEACGFRDLASEFDKEGITVLGVSADNLSSHRRFVDKYGLSFPLLSDVDKTLADAYGAWGEKEVRGKKVIGMRRMTFLIDEQGKLNKVWPTVKPEGHAEEVLQASKSI